MPLWCDKPPPLLTGNKICSGDSRIRSYCWDSYGTGMYVAALCPERSREAPRLACPSHSAWPGARDRTFQPPLILSALQITGAPATPSRTAPTPAARHLAARYSSTFPPRWRCVTRAGVARFLSQSAQLRPSPPLFVEN
eukprot:scaffold76250_cov27-Tisochrysis_lutea.AAC.7